MAPYDNLIPRGEFARQLRNRGVGLCCRRATVWSEMPNVAVEKRTAGDTVTTCYHTPRGSVSAKSRTHLGRISDGSSVSTERLIKNVDDYAPVIFMLEDAIFHLDASIYRDTQRDLGSDGIVRITGIRPPYDASQYYFSLERWAAEQVDHPEHFGRLLQALENYADRQLQLLVESPGEFVGLGSIDGWYSPGKMKEFVLPFYQKVVPRLQEAGKLCAVHAHASKLKGCKELIVQMNFDVVEAFTPPPIGDLSLAEARAAWGRDTVIWVNFPETIFWLGEKETREYTADLLRSDPPGDALVIGMTEMGTYGIQDEASERTFKRGMIALVETVEEVGRYPIA
jgi:hypothetical protein